VTKVLSQDETPFLYSIVFGEGVVNDATSIVLFNSVQSLDISSINVITVLKLLGTFLYLFCTSTALGVAVSSI
jgi:sodium/hydrogen exchanger 8